MFSRRDMLAVSAIAGPGGNVGLRDDGQRIDPEEEPDVRHLWM